MSKIYRILFLLVFGFFVFGQLERIEIGVGRAIYIHELILTLLVALFITQEPRQLLKHLSSSRLIQLIAFFNAIVLANVIIWFHSDPNHILTGILYLFRLDMYIFFGAATYSLMKNHTLSLTEVKLTVISSILLIAILGWGQYLMFPDTRWLFVLGWDDHYYRLISTIFDPGFTGIILVIGLLLILSSRLFSSSIQNAIYFILLFSALLLTYSRASYVSLVAGILYLFWKTKKTALLLIIGLLIVGLLFLPRPGGEGVKLARTASITARLDSVQTSFSHFSLVNSLIGRGWYEKKRIDPKNHSSAPENSFVFVFTSLGALGLSVWLLIVRKTFQIEGLSVLVILVHSLFSNTFFHPFVLLLLVTILAYTATEQT